MTKTSIHVFEKKLKNKSTLSFFLIQENSLQHKNSISYFLLRKIIKLVLNYDK